MKNKVISVFATACLAVGLLTGCGDSSKGNQIGQSGNKGNENVNEVVSGGDSEGAQTYSGVEFIICNKHGKVVYYRELSEWTPDEETEYFKEPNDGICTGAHLEGYDYIVPQQWVDMRPDLWSEGFNVVVTDSWVSQFSDTMTLQNNKSFKIKEVSIGGVTYPYEIGLEGMNEGFTCLSIGNMTSEEYQVFDSPWAEEIEEAPEEVNEP